MVLNESKTKWPLYIKSLQGTFRDRMFDAIHVIYRKDFTLFPIPQPTRLQLKQLHNSLKRFFPPRRGGHILSKYNAPQRSPTDTVIDIHGVHEYVNVRWVTLVQSLSLPLSSGEFPRLQLTSPSPQRALPILKVVQSPITPDHQCSKAQGLIPHTWLHKWNRSCDSLDRLSDNAGHICGDAILIESKMGFFFFLTLYPARHSLSSETFYKKLRVW